MKSAIRHRIKKIGAWSCNRTTQGTTHSDSPPSLWREQGQMANMNSFNLNTSNILAHLAGNRPPGLPTPLCSRATQSLSYQFLPSTGGGKGLFCAEFGRTQRRNPVSNNGQSKMVGKGCSEIFVNIINFKLTGDRDVGGKPTTMFGPRR